MSARTILRLAALLSVLTLIALAVLVPPDGQERGDLLQFFGNFHPLAVHFPIALLLLMPVLEVAGGLPKWRALRSAAGFVLGLAALSAIAVPYMGWLLAWSGGFEGALVTQHMWGGIAVAGSATLCWILRGSSEKAPDTLSVRYVAMLTLTVLTVAFTGYRGGQLAHGENHLTEHLPLELQERLGVVSKTTIAGAPVGSFYAARVAPIFEDHCLLCHSASKRKGGLQLDSYAALMRGGKDGVVIKAGDAKGSDLLRRINLDPSEEGFMPAEGKPPLGEADRNVLALWVEAGASPTLAINAIAGAPAVESPAQPLAPDYRPDQALIAKLASALNVQLLPRSQNPTDGLVLRTASAPAACDDATLVKLVPVARYIVDAELARTKVSDAGAETLAQFTNLRWLDLSHTTITSAGVQRLTQLEELAVLNLTGTEVNDSGVEVLHQNKSFRHVYVFQTNTAP